MEKPYSVKAVYNCLTKFKERLDMPDKTRPIMPTGNTSVERKKDELSDTIRIIYNSKKPLS